MKEPGGPADSNEGNKDTSKSREGQPPAHNPDEIEEVAREMGYLPDKSGQEYIDHLREDTDVTVMGTPERVRSFFNPQAERWTEPMYPGDGHAGQPTSNTD